MRRLPNITPNGKIAPYLSKDENNNTISQDSKGNVTFHVERKYELITPLFGGGVEAGKNDNITPISGKVIRGHLRFWWRATRGGQFNGDLEAMKAREAEIWGAASTLVCLGGKGNFEGAVQDEGRLVSRHGPQQPRQRK